MRVLSSGEGIVAAGWKDSWRPMPPAVEINKDCGERDEAQPCLWVVVDWARSDEVQREAEAGLGWEKSWLGTRH